MEYKPIAYIRVSKHIGMTVENQRAPIEVWCKANGILLENIYWVIEEESTRKERPNQKQTFEWLMNGRYNLLLCLRLDRWGRSSKELCDTVLNMVHIAGARVVFVANSMDMKKEGMNAVQTLMLQIFASFAEYERALIQERTLEGLARAKREGRTGGRPKGSKDSVKRGGIGYRAGWIKRRQREKDVERAIKQIKNPCMVK